jgi:hypothetical protein
MSRVGLVLSPVVGLLALLLGTVLVLGPDDVAYACAPAGSGSAELTSDQWRNASTIVAEGARLHVPDRGLVIGIAAALQESGLRNLTYGDRDSLGLFQQRPSMGWGTPAQVMDPAYAAHAFFTGAGTNDGLLDIAGWQLLPLWLAADSVQHSAYPTAYADHEADATAIVHSITHQDDTFCSSGAAICPPVELPVLAGLTADARQVVFCVVGHFAITDLLGVGDRPSNPTSDHPSGRAVDVMIADYQTDAGRHLGDAIAAWLQDHAASLGITYVIWNARIWSPERAAEGWRPYVHPSGAIDDTSAHRNHVHVSVVGDATVTSST